MFLKKYMQYLKSNNQGQTLIESIVAVGVVILLTTGLIAGTSAALRSSAYTRSRSESTKLVQEAVEIARNDRDNGWYSFYALDTSPADGNPTYYCLGGTDLTFKSPNAPIAGDPLTDPALCANNVSINAGTLILRFRRYAGIKWDSANSRMIVNVYVNWQEGSLIRRSAAETYFTQWR